jgi:hypothetical protein
MCNSRRWGIRKINSALIAAAGNPTQGASYKFFDSGLRNGKTYYYKLEDVDLNGASIMHQAVSATPRWIYNFWKQFIETFIIMCNLGMVEVFCF